MKLLVFTAVWQRPEITEICFMGINRLKKIADVEGFAVISEDSMIPLCDKYEIGWCMTANSPLGAKKNFGLNEATKKEFDYLVEIGSDDLLKNEFLDLYDWTSPVCGLMDFALINTVDGRCKSIHTKIPKFGAGRAIRRDVLELGNLWSGKKNNGLDNNSNFNMMRNGFMPRGFKSEPVAIALKSDVNLWPFKAIPGQEYPLDKALNGLSEEEINAIRCLAVKNKSESLIDG